MRRMHTLVGIALLAVLAAPAAGASFDEWLPETTILYVSVENVSELGARFEKGPLGALWNEEEVQAFLELPLQMLEEQLLEASDVLGGARPDDLLKMLTGQVAFAFTGLRKTELGPMRPGGVVLADIGENGQKVREWFSRIEKSEAFSEKFRLIEGEFRGVRIVTYVADDEDEDKDDEADKGDEVVTGPPCYFIDGSVLAFSADPELLEDILDRRGTEDASGLADSEDYRTVRRRIGPNADVVAYVSVTQGVRTAFAQVDDEEAVKKDKSIIAALGLDTVRALGFQYAIGDAGSSYNVFVYAPGKKNGVLKLLGAENSALVPPALVPPDVAFAMTLSLDFQELWQEGLRVAERMEPGCTGSLDEYLAMLKESTGIDIQEDLIDSLGTKITLYSFAQQDVEDDASTGGMTLEARAVYAIELSNPDKMGEVLETLVGMSPIPIDSQEYMGVTLHVVDTGVLKICVATVAGHLVIASTIDDLRAIVQSQGKETRGLADAEDFARAMADLPESRSLVSFTDPRLSGGVILQLLSQATPFLTMSYPGLSEWLDLGLIPDPEIFKKYMDVSGGAMATEEDGVFLKFISRMKMPE